MVEVDQIDRHYYMHRNIFFLTAAILLLYTRIKLEGKYILPRTSTLSVSLYTFHSSSFFFGVCWHPLLLQWKRMKLLRRTFLDHSKLFDFFLFSKGRIDFFLFFVCNYSYSYFFYKCVFAYYNENLSY